MLADIRTEEVLDDNFDPIAAANEIKEPVSKRGDIWQLGKHRLMCGDSTDLNDVKKLMNVKVETQSPVSNSFSNTNQHQNLDNQNTFDGVSNDLTKSIDNNFRN